MTSVPAEELAERRALGARYHAQQRINEIDGLIRGYRAAVNLIIREEKALQDRKAAKAASEPEIPANCNRAELDAVMWRLWDHGKGKTPDEISDILCSRGYSYGAAMVERRLRQQWAEL